MLNTIHTNYAQPFLFEPVIPASSCHSCFDTGIVLNPNNQIETCPRILRRQPHADPNHAALIMRRGANDLFARQIWINPQAFDTARILTHYASGKPCERDTLINFFFADTELRAANRLRKFHLIIEELRNVWLLPIGSRKLEPFGYWIITDVDDCKAWLRHSNAAPIKQLSTNWHVAKHNFPMLAGQREFAFMEQLETQIDETN